MRTLLIVVAICISLFTFEGIRTCERAGDASEYASITNDCHNSNLNDYFGSLIKG